MNSFLEDVWWYIFMTTRIWIIIGCSSDQSIRLFGSSSLQTVTNMRRDSQIIHGYECSFWLRRNVRDWFRWIQSWMDELSKLTREGRNLFFWTRACMTLTYDRESTMISHLSLRLFSKSPAIMDERVRRRIVRKFSVRRDSLKSPAARSHDFFSPVVISFQIRKPRLVYGQIESFLCMNIFGRVWRLFELIDGDLFRCAKDIFELWIGILTVYYLQLMISRIFVMGPVLWHKSRKLTSPICGSSYPFSFRLTKTTGLSENLRMICGSSGLNMMSMMIDTKVDVISSVRQLLRCPRIGHLMM